jgi:hypothetical protein
MNLVEDSGKAVNCDIVTVDEKFRERSILGELETNAGQCFTFLLKQLLRLRMSNEKEAKSSLLEESRVVILAGILGVDDLQQMDGMTVSLEAIAGVLGSSDLLMAILNKPNQLGRPLCLSLLGKAAVLSGDILALGKFLALAGPSCDLTDLFGMTARHNLPRVIDALLRWEKGRFAGTNCRSK